MLSKILGFDAREALSYSLDILFDGKHVGSGAADNASVLIDESSRRQGIPFNAGVVGKVIYNLTDGSSAIITAQTNHTITGTLANGTGNDWDLGDEYIIGSPSLNVQQQPFEFITAGRKEVTTAGTRVQLVATPTPCKKLLVQALQDNTNAVTIGDVTVVGAAATQIGIALKPAAGFSDWIEVPVNDVQKVYVDAITSGEGVGFIYFN